MTPHTPTQAETSERGFRLSRLYPAPRALVFESWTQARHLDRWWGPQGFSVTTQEIDVTPGGLWRFIMHGPDGTDYPSLIRYSEVVPAQRLVYHHIGDDIGDDIEAGFASRVTFTEEAGQTRLVMSVTFQKASDFDRMKPFAVPGGLSTLERLSALLDELQTR